MSLMGRVFPLTMAQAFVLPMALISLALIGCATRGPVFDNLAEAPRDAAILYIYRPASFKDRGLIPAVYLNTIHRVDLRNGAFAELKLKPGTYTLQVMGRAASPRIVSLGEMQVELREGQHYFVKWWPELNVMGLASGVRIQVLGKIAAVQEERALEEIATLVRLKEVAVHERKDLEALQQRKRRR